MRRLQRAFATLTFLTMPAQAATAASAIAIQDSAAGKIDAAYVAEIEAWRERRDEGLRRDDGWLTLVGLFWLREGENRFGSDPSNALVFPRGKIPPFAGAFELAKGSVTVRVRAGVGITHEGESVTVMELVSDQEEGTTLLRSGSLSFYVIERGERVAIRLKDRESRTLAEFTGIDFFPVASSWRIVARFESYDPPRTLRVPNILGDTFEDTTPGIAAFEVAGETYRLEPVGKAGEPLFFVFGDETNGSETYGGGRYLVADPPGPDGTVVLDFNKAYNPPCVFTPYATCPLPRRENRLPLRVEAGERMYGAEH